VQGDGEWRTCGGVCNPVDMVKDLFTSLGADSEGMVIGRVDMWKRWWEYGCRDWAACWRIDNNIDLEHDRTNKGISRNWTMKGLLKRREVCEASTGAIQQVRKQTICLRKGFPLPQPSVPKPHQLNADTRHSPFLCRQQHPMSL
jgi:hypothetical protein